MGSLSVSEILALAGKKPKPETVAPAEVVIKKVELSERKKFLLQTIADILAKHDNMESNIPINHEYWRLLHEYRGN